MTINALGLLKNALSGVRQATYLELIMSQQFQAARYRDNDTGRYRWAVFCTPSSTWIFSSRYGQAAAKALAHRLNNEIGRDAS